jgi:hypothetical protein
LSIAKLYSQWILIRESFTLSCKIVRALSAGRRGRRDEKQ